MIFFLLSSCALFLFARAAIAAAGANFGSGFFLVDFFGRCWFFVSHDFLIIFWQQ